jgi:BirA family biotin operon repressor/biotin-[acetyl-CoA-carboxylase] ligase
MIRLDPGAIRASLDAATVDRLAQLEVFEEIASTNTYLMEQAPPPPGWLRVALTDNQVAGRGRHGRVWQSPPGSGIAVSIGYTFARQPANLAALTLAIGIGVVEALGKVGVPGVQLKWPNDLIARDGKLGGIRTETQPLPRGAIMVVSGLGLNLALDHELAAVLASDGSRRVVDLAGLTDLPPCRNDLTAKLIESFRATFVTYETLGFSAFVGRWGQSDWLRDRELTVHGPHASLAGTGAGIAADGALLVTTATGDVCRITSGSVVVAGTRDVSL